MPQLLSLGADCNTRIATLNARAHHSGDHCRDSFIASTCPKGRIQPRLTQRLCHAPVQLEHERQDEDQRARRANEEQQDAHTALKRLDKELKGLKVGQLHPAG